MDAWDDDDSNELPFDWDNDDFKDGAEKLAKDNVVHKRPKRNAQKIDSLESLPEPQALGGKS